MNRLAISRFLASIILLACIGGCATVWDDPLPQPSQRTKSEVLKIWGSPIKIYREPDKLKYGADEMWIYKNPEPGHPSLIEERLYFKEGILIRREGINRDSL